MPKSSSRVQLVLLTSSAGLVCSDCAWPDSWLVKSVASGGSLRQAQQWVWGSGVYGCDEDPLSAQRVLQGYKDRVSLHRLSAPHCWQVITECICETSAIGPHYAGSLGWTAVTELQHPALVISHRPQELEQTAGSEQKIGTSMHACRHED